MNGNSDPLCAETSVSAELTETSVKANAKSRTVAALDRLVGNLADWGNVLLEPGLILRRTRMEGERELLKEIAKYGVERVGSDPDLAERALINHFGKILKHQENRDAVAGAALQDLCDKPPTTEEEVAGGESPNEEFLDRLDDYAMAASTEQARQRWGRVLAQEIRRPGTFSQKVLRTIDELEPDTAQLFEEICGYRYGPALCNKLLGRDMTFEERAALVEAGLIIEPGVSGHAAGFGRATFNGVEFHILRFSYIAVVIPFDLPADDLDDQFLWWDGQELLLRSYILTEVGRAVASILDPASKEIEQRIFEAIRAACSGNAYLGIMTNGRVSIPDEAFAAASKTLS